MLAWVSLVGGRRTIDARSLFLVAVVCSVSACEVGPAVSAVGGSSGNMESTGPEPAASSSTGDGSTSTSNANDTSSSGDELEATVGSSSTGETSLCGDGVVDSGEDCDDGNTNDQDLCHDDCTIAYSIEYTLEFDGGAGEDDGVGGLAVLGDAVWLAGEADDGRGDIVPHLWRLGPDATRLTSWSYIPPGSTSGRWASVAPHPSGDLIVAGYATAPDTIEHGILARVDPTQPEPVWLHQLDPAAGESYGIDVKVGPEGQVVWGGHRRGDVFFDLFVQSLDADGVLQWDRGYAGAHQRSDLTRALDVDALGRIFVAAKTHEEPLEETPWVGAWESDGTPLWSASLPSGDASEIVVAPDGELVIAGSGGGAWIERRSADDFALLSHDVVNGASSFIEGLVVDDAGGVWTAGAVSVPGLSWNIWAAHIGPDAEIDWENAYSGDAGLNDFGRAIIRDGDSVVVAGTQVVLGEGSNIWVRRYGVSNR